MKTHKNTFCILLAVLFLFSGLGWAQEGEGEDQAGQEAEEEALIAPEQKVEPVFPEENEALIFIEGEDAVSTNFTNEPILNYSCSKFRTLQPAFREADPSTQPSCCTSKTAGSTSCGTVARPRDPLTSFFPPTPLPSPSVWTAGKHCRWIGRMWRLSSSTHRPTTGITWETSGWTRGSTPSIFW